MLTKEDLKKISLGNYQINQMSAYCIEHIKSCGDCFVFHKCTQSIKTTFLADLISRKELNDPILIYTKLHSRFRKKSTYQTFVLIDAAVDGVAGVIDYSCECRHGLRTVGCCSHIMAVIGYFGYLRNNRESLKAASSFLDGLFEV